ncbi:MAG: hypothetical protein ACQES9_03770 [Myxococcota bacterium]
MKRLIYIFVLATSLFYSSISTAKVLEIFFQPQTGGMFGLYSQAKLPWEDTERELNTEEDYFMTHQGGNAGFSAGLEFMFIDLVLDVNQFYRSNRKSTFFALLAGLDADFKMSRNSVWTMYLLGGVALATIDDEWADEVHIAHEDLYSQIALLRLGARYEYKIFENIRLSLDGGIGAHFLQLSQKGANQDDSQSSGVHAYFSAGIRVYFDFFGGEDEIENEESGKIIVLKEQAPKNNTNDVQDNKPATPATDTVDKKDSSTAGEKENQ